MGEVGHLTVDLQFRDPQDCRILVEVFRVLQSSSSTPTFSSCFWSAEKVPAGEWRTFQWRGGSVCGSSN